MAEILFQKITSETELNLLIDAELKLYTYTRVLAEAFRDTTDPDNWYLIEDDLPAHDAGASGETLLRLIGSPIDVEKGVVKFVAGAYHKNSQKDSRRWIRSGLMIDDHLSISQVAEDPRIEIYNYSYHPLAFLEANDNELNGIGSDQIKFGTRAKFLGFHEFPASGTVRITDSPLGIWLFQRVIPNVMDRFSARDT